MWSYTCQRIQSAGAIVVQSCITRGQVLLARLTALRSRSSTAHPAGSRTQSPGAQEPPGSDQIHPLQCYKKTRREKLQGFVW